jgi:hypothetical protein
MRTILLAALLAAMAAPAFADETWTATLAQPATLSNFPAGDVLWSCDKSGCQTTSDIATGDPKRACYDLVYRFGPLTAFATSHPFSADSLAKCNAVASKK